MPQNDINLLDAVRQQVKCNTGTCRRIAAFADNVNWALRHLDFTAYTRKRGTISKKPYYAP
jgi:hypothetical protein